MEIRQILDFLSELTENNHRDWMQAHKVEYQKAKKTFEEIVAKLLAEFSQVEDALMNLQVKDCIFRINRDIRFTKDKCPYKSNFGASLSPEGRRSPYASYYLHIQPQGNSFIGGGMYAPSPQILKNIRQEIDYQGEEFRAILAEPSFQQYFGGLRDFRLKTTPKGYHKDHPDIKHLRQTRFVLMHQLEDEDLTRPDFLHKVLEVFEIMRPFNHFLNRALE